MNWLKVDLTPLQKELAEWAVEPMITYLSEDCEDVNVPKAQIARVEGSILYISSHEDVIDDFKYRLEEQYVDMCLAEFDKIAAVNKMRTAYNIVRKIKSLMKGV